MNERDRTKLLRVSASLQGVQYVRHTGESPKRGNAPDPVFEDVTKALTPREKLLDAIESDLQANGWEFDSYVELLRRGLGAPDALQRPGRPAASRPLPPVGARAVNPSARAREANEATARWHERQAELRRQRSAPEPQDTGGERQPLESGARGTSPRTHAESHLDSTP